MNYTPDAAQISMLRMFTPNNHSIQLKPGTDRDLLLVHGLVSLLPAIWVSKCRFAITDKGKLALKVAA